MPADPERKLMERLTHDARRRVPVQYALQLLIQNLDTLRELVHLGLDDVEKQVRTQISQQSAILKSGPEPVAHSQNPTEREQRLQKRVSELEQAQLNLRADVERWERDREDLLVQIEHDRRMLAEAWERLEYEQTHGQVSTTSPPDTRRPGQAPAPAHFERQANPAGAAPVSPDRNTAPRQAAPANQASPTAQDDSVAQAILRQFQSLQRDVRRNG